MKLYIAGPITGIENYRENFDQAAVQLVDKGYEVASPTWFDLQGQMLEWTWNDYMKATIQMMLNCDAVAYLPGFEASKGSVMEIELAKRLGMDVQPLEEWLV